MKSIPKVKALLFMKGYSERVPRKNLKTFCGKPLLHWILETLSKSKHIGEIIINTDDDEIASEAADNFKVTIHKRPEYLLTITSNEANQIIAYDISVTDGDFFLQTHCTNPLLKRKTIDRAVETYFRNIQNCDSLISVTPVQKRFFWETGEPINHNPDQLIKTQELPFLYEENSCIYIFSRSIFEKYKNRMGRNPMMFMMDPYETIDIDTQFDFSFAEIMMREQLKMKNKIGVNKNP